MGELDLAGCDSLREILVSDDGDITDCLASIRPLPTLGRGRTCTRGDRSRRPAALMVKAASSRRGQSPPLQNPAITEAPSVIERKLPLLLRFSDQRMADDDRQCLSPGLSRPHPALSRREQGNREHFQEILTGLQEIRPSHHRGATGGGIGVSRACPGLIHAPMSFGKPGWHWRDEAEGECYTDTTEPRRLASALWYSVTYSCAERVQEKSACMARCMRRSQAARSRYTIKACCKVASIASAS